MPRKGTARVPAWGRVALPKGDRVAQLVENTSGRDEPDWVCLRKGRLWQPVVIALRGAPSQSFSLQRPRRGDGAFHRGGPLLADQVAQGIEGGWGESANSSASRSSIRTRRMGYGWPDCSPTMLGLCREVPIGADTSAHRSPGIESNAQLF